MNVILKIFDVGLQIVWHTSEQSLPLGKNGEGMRSYVA